MLFALLRAILFGLALVMPGGFLFLAAAALWRRRQLLKSLDFDGLRRRVPPTRRGRHQPILVTGS